MALGHEAPDQIKRISRGEFFTCVDGSEEEHDVLREFCQELLTWLASMDLELDDLSPAELQAFLEQHLEGVVDP